MVGIMGFLLRIPVFKTIGEGIAAAAGKLVLVCDTTYDEKLSINTATKLYGGFNCADWSVVSGEQAIVKPTTAKPAGPSPSPFAPRKPITQSSVFGKPDNAPPVISRPAATTSAACWDTSVAI